MNERERRKHSECGWVIHVSGTPTLLLSWDSSLTVCEFIEREFKSTANILFIYTNQKWREFSSISRL